MFVCTVHGFFFSLNILTPRRRIFRIAIILVLCPLQLASIFAYFNDKITGEQKSKPKQKLVESQLKSVMITFTEVHQLIAESIFFKFSGYFLPLLLFILTKHVWQRFACDVNEARSQKEVIDISDNIQTDTTIDELNDEEYKPHLPERDHVPYRKITEWLDKSGEKFYKVANNRRSIRKFSTKQPDFRVIEQCILAAGKCTPVDFGQSLGMKDFVLNLFVF